MRKTGLQKVSSIIIYSSAFGVFIALTLIVLHMRHIGFPLLNFSLILFIAGIIVLMTALLSSKNAAPNPAFRGQSIIYNNILCLGVICTITGMLLRINHYPGGKLLMFGSLAFTMGFLVFLIIYAMYIKKK
jgi:hypothetical protein